MQTNTQSNAAGDARQKLTASGKFARLLFYDLAIGANFFRGDGENGGSFDKVSATTAKRCSLAGDCKPQPFAPSAKVLVFATL